MRASWHRLLIRLGRWPRRVAALCCLLLAAGTAVAPPPRPADAARAPVPRLRAGEVAVPVPVMSAGTAVRPGDRVGVLAAPPDDASADAVLVADRLQVLSVHADPAAALGGDRSTVVVLATDRAHAVLLARYLARRLVLIVDNVH